ncbi:MULTISPECIES: extracellular solute-binding protein [Paenibacillus]|uniref:extracellular solute-binding protein n=1 Tax=Paenibacillus TaxID=44249 RepID=UPI0022B88CA8|nr:extracellular solute-binding protein [Paenibacillus caseinilyticus]MCZ8520677.1 extracellular solute-binding protein [Paenibacillus caseinilyticus]
MSAVLACTMLMSGCSLGQGGEGKGALKPLGKDEKAVIKVMYYDKSSLFQQYGALFMAKYPNVDVEVVSTQSLYGAGKDPLKAFGELVEDEKPDVLFINFPNAFAKWAGDGKLLPLDEVIQADKFDLENMLPAVTETLRAQGGGKLYGLSPSFYSNALFYNKSLFEKHGVPLPKDGMTWVEVMELARRFPTGGQGAERVYGYGENNAYMGGEPIGFRYFTMIGRTNGLDYMDPKRENITLQTEGWKQALQLTAESMKSGALYDPAKEPQLDMNKSVTMGEMMERNPFISGKVAMTLEGTYLISEIERAKEMWKDKEPVNWDVVTVPVDPQNPGKTDSLSISEVFSVDAASPNARAAWEFVKYVNSEEMARLKSKMGEGRLLSRTAYVKEKDGRSLEPFYKLGMSEKEASGPAEGAEVPMSFYSEFTKIGGEEVQAVIDGKKSEDAALAAMQTRMQEALIKTKHDEAAKKQQEEAAKPAG